MPLRKFTCSIATLGCKVNQAEASELEKSLSRQGWSATTPAQLDGDEPEVYMVNTCAVTKVSESKSRRLIKRIIRENPSSRIIVTGCYATSNPEEIKSVIRKGFDTIVPQAIKNQIPDMLENVGANPRVRHDLGHPESIRDAPTMRTRAFLKIQDGCANFCSYCIVPLLRGKPVSKPLTTALNEAKDLAKHGYREIVLTGINLGACNELIGLLKRMYSIEELERIRLSSIEVNDVTIDLIQLMRDNPKICPHLHIPLQSGSNRILKLMNRRYTSEEYLEKVNKIKLGLDNPGITTDIIVGFPGETAKDFQETMETAQKAGFSKIHIFPYSPRPGTKAETFIDKCPTNVVKERCQQLDKLQRNLAMSYKEKFINKEITILLEGKGNTGYTKEYLKVRLNKSCPDKVNQLVNTLIKCATPEYLEGDYGKDN